MRMRMRQLTIFITLFVHCGLFAQSPELIFHSGFEPGVQTTDPEDDNDIDIIGSDGSMPGFDDWVNDLETHSNIGYFKVQFQGGDATMRNAEIVPDPLDPSNNTLRFWAREVNSGNNGRVQGNIYNSDNGFSNMFYSVRL